MSLSAYKAFLASPSPAALADNASLHYVTTLTSIHETPAILRHFSAQEKLLKKKEQKVLSVVDGGNALALDVDTTIEFVNGGGAYLPGLDDNFVADRVATFPMVHIVHFDDQQKIVQIRLYWDQGSLLKQIEVMGARARNWPVRDGKDQSRLIATSTATISHEHTSQAPSAHRGTDQVAIADRPIRTSTSNAMNDPHASLDLFQPRDVNRETSPSRPIGARMQSAKPPPRELSDLFVGEENASFSHAPNESPSKHAKGGAGKNYKANRLFDGPEDEGADENESPSKHGIYAKAGSGKNHKENRLFEETEEEKAAPPPMSTRKTNAKKYNHFEFGEGEDTPKAKEGGDPARKSRHQSNWDFDDFVTPEKTKTKVLAQSIRHFGWSDDEVGDFYEPELSKEEGSPVRRPVVHKERPNLNANFEFDDQGTPEDQRKANPTKGGLGNKGMGLYKDHVLGSASDDEDVTPKGDTKRALNDVSFHTKNENRKKDFGSSFEMKDDSPAHDKTYKENVPEIKKKATATNWSHYENSPESRGINIAGNGMGGRKGTEFSLYDDDTNAAQTGIKSMGNGMGGRKGTGFDWDF